MPASQHAVKMLRNAACGGQKSLQRPFFKCPSPLCPSLSRSPVTLLTRSVSSSSEHRDQPRPAFAPKPTIDIRAIREQPALYAQNCRDRNYVAQADDPATLHDLFEKWKASQQQALSLRQRNKKLKLQLSRGSADGETTFAGGKEEALQEARALKAQLHTIEAEEQQLTRQMEELAIAQPNLTSAETPVGDAPEVIDYIHDDKAARESEELVWRSHVDIGTELDLLDFQAAGQTSGWGWYYLKNEAALLEQALVQYAISIARSHGFNVVAPPSMVYSHMAAACGFRPRDQGGEQQIYSIQQPDTQRNKAELSMAGTAEIPFAALKANTDIDETELPLRIVGSSRCYRAEAGSRGVSTKGLYRVHEFTKVEMFAWTAPQPDAVRAVFDQMVGIQKHILHQLGLRCRVLEQPSADLGASATRKQDIEAWFPSRRHRDGGWGEVTSTSICTDYQTRRLATRLRSAKSSSGHSSGAAAKAWPYTVNGTAVAVPRVLAAILETHWDEAERAVRIPECLWPWMHGVMEIRKPAAERDISTAS